MPIHREPGLAVLFGVHFTPWRAQWVDEHRTVRRSRWLVFYCGPWRWETEIIRDIEDED